MHEYNNLINSIVFNVQKAITQLVTGWIFHCLTIVDNLDAIPEVSHVECMGYAFHRRPVRSQTIFLITDLSEDAVNHVHGFGEEIIT